MKCRKCGQDNPPEAGFCSKCGTPLAAISLEPGVGSAYSNGWQQLWKHFWELLVSGIIAVVLTAIVGIIISLIFFNYIQDEFFIPTGVWSFDYFETFPWGFQAVNIVVQVFYYTPIAFGLAYVFMTAARGDKVELGNLFSGFRNYGNVILVGILYLIVFGGVSLLLAFLTVFSGILGIFLNIIWLIIMIILYCKLAFVPYLLLDRKMKAVESIQTSWVMTRGHAGKIFLIGFLAFLMFLALAIISFIFSFLLGFFIGFFFIFIIIVFCIAAIILAMWISTAFGSLYHAVSTSYQFSQPQPPAPAGSVQTAT